MDTCKYVHYEIDAPPEAEGGLMGPQAGGMEVGLHQGEEDSNVGKLFPSQVRERRNKVREEGEGHEGKRGRPMKREEEEEGD